VEVAMPHVDTLVGQTLSSYLLRNGWVLHCLSGG
jgi:hypothetical protein